MISFKVKSRQWLRQWLGAIRQQDIIWASVDHGLYHHITLLATINLTHRTPISRSHWWVMSISSELWPCINETWLQQWSLRPDASGMNPQHPYQEKLLLSMSIAFHNYDLRLWLFCVFGCGIISSQFTHIIHDCTASSGTIIAPVPMK